MINRLIYISLLILWGCDMLEEQTASLPGDYYIEDGWQAFISKNYDEAEFHFMTAIETNEEWSIHHFRSYIGLGWTYMYKTKTNPDTTGSREFIQASRDNFDTAEKVLLEESLSIDSSDVENLYVGLAFQRAYEAKQKSVNGASWESANLSLDSTVQNLYKESLDFINNPHLVDENGNFYKYYFIYDDSLDDVALMLLRLENYILLGEIQEAVDEFRISDFECSQEIHGQTIIECLCEVANDGECPFEQE